MCWGVKPFAETLSAKFRERDRDLTWVLVGADEPTALVVVTCAVDGAGDVGREGRLRMGRVRSAFILNDVDEKGRKTGKGCRYIREKIQV